MYSIDTMIPVHIHTLKYEHMPISLCNGQKSKEKLLEIF